MKKENSQQARSTKSHSIASEAHQPLSYSEEQLKTLAVLQSLKLAKVMFYFLLVAFVLVFAALLCSVFWFKTDIRTSGAFFILDGIIGWSFRYVVTYLFPSNNTGLLKQLTQKFLGGNDSGKDK